VAALAVSRFGADPVRVELAVQGVLQAQARGQAVDLLATLVVHKLLNPSQAEALREELVMGHPSDNGMAGANRETPGPAGTRPALPNDSPEMPATSSGQYLRTLGEFRLLRRLGQGGMGSVYLGYEDSRQRQVAIKVLSDQLVNEAYVERFYREAKSGALLDHANIVRCITAGQDEATGKHYLVLEFVDGFSAHDLLDRVGRLSVGDAVHLALDIARGLEHAHSRNLIHRDIKPDNILITRSGVAKLADLGLAKRLDEVSNLTGLRVGIGTLDYIPYEQAINAKQADARSDIYALGGTLYHLLTGKVPFPAKNYMEVAEKKLQGVYAPASVLNPEVPPVLDRILDKMLAKEPRDRYQLVSELIVELERSNLASPVPSFADADLALQDPLVRERLAAPAQATRLDMQVQTQQQGTADSGNPDIWYLRFRNREGQWCKTKLATEQILERLAAGRLAKHVEASRQPRGEYRVLGMYSEFREAVASSPRRRSSHHHVVLPDKREAPSAGAAAPTPGPGHPFGLTRKWLLLGAGVGVGLLVTAAIAAYDLLF
jgi:serine/threonine-protein kinase